MSSVSPSAQQGDASSWSSVDLAEVLAALCLHCSDLARVAACSIVLREMSQGFFSAAGSAEWACGLDDFQLSEEAGPTWECCTSGNTSRDVGLDRHGITGAVLADQASRYGIVGCRAVPLSSQGEIVGALSLYWGESTRENTLLTTAIAVGALATRAIEFQRAQDRKLSPLDPDPQRIAIFDGGDPAFVSRDTRAVARDARARARDARAEARDARAAAREARAAARDNEARARGGQLSASGAAALVQARRDRFGAARERFHAKSDRAAARLDRLVSAAERVESSVDGLTGAYRRDAGMLELEHEVTRARRTGDPFVLAFVDVNNLKARNDTLGHQAGDQLLRRVADTMRANVRSYDLVVRYGGDEFVCGFPTLDMDDAAERFARINRDLAAHDEASIAFGLAALEGDESLTELITRADDAMYATRYRRVHEGDPVTVREEVSSTAE